MEEFISIKEHSYSEFMEKKSKFIGNLFYVESVEEAEEIIKKVRKKYFDAKHNCIAYRILEKEQIVERFSDDGEPQGTAGAPMLNILQKNNLLNVLIVVTRYFGGILLGTGGLLRAYQNSLMLTIENGEKVKKCAGDVLEIVLEYSDFENFKYYCKNNKINITKTEYAAKIVCKIELEVDKKQKLLKDFETKNIKLSNIKELYKKFITKSI